MFVNFVVEFPIRRGAQRHIALCTKIIDTRMRELYRDSIEMSAERQLQNYNEIFLDQRCVEILSQPIIVFHRQTLIKRTSFLLRIVSGLF